MCRGDNICRHTYVLRFRDFVNVSRLPYKTERFFSQKVIVRQPCGSVIMMSIRLYISESNCRNVILNVLEHVYNVIDKINTSFKK